MSTENNNYMLPCPECFEDGLTFANNVYDGENNAIKMTCEFCGKVTDVVFTKEAINGYIELGVEIYLKTLCDAKMEMLDGDYNDE